MGHSPGHQHYYGGGLSGGGQRKGIGLLLSRLEAARDKSRGHPRSEQSPKIVEQGCPTAVECLEIGGLIVRGTLLPTPKEHADPLERQRAYGGLVGLALVALRLGIDLCPAGMPRGFRRPFHEGVAAELRAWEAPVDPRLLAATFGDGCNPGVPLEFGGRRRAVALCPKGDEQPGGEDGPCAREGLDEGESGMTLGPRRDGVVKGLDRLSGHAKLAD